MHLQSTSVPIQADLCILFAIFCGFLWFDKTWGFSHQKPPNLQQNAKISSIKHKFLCKQLKFDQSMLIWVLKSKTKPCSYKTFFHAPQLLFKLLLKIL